MFPWDLLQIPRASFSSTDISNIKGSARSYGPRSRAACTTHKSSPLKTQPFWVSLFGIEKVSKGDLEYMWEAKMRRKEILFLSQAYKEKHWVSADLAYLPENPRRLISASRSMDSCGQVCFVVGYMVASLGCMKRSHVRPPTPYYSLLPTIFTLIHLITHPLVLWVDQPHQQIQHSES